MDGLPTLCKDGKPFYPLAFWQHEIADPDISAFRQAGVRIFTCFASEPYFEHPYWVGENEYDFSYYDAALNRFAELVPDGFIIPRIFVAAPYWWLEKHPEELVGYADNAPYVRGSFDGTFHESFASELWKREQGKALTELIRHFRNAPYAKHILGIHIAGGTCGEWHYWGYSHLPDCGQAMARRLGRAVPPPELRDAEYYRCYFTSTVDAIDHFCKIVKKESDYLTVVFYAYLAEYYNFESSHCATEEFLQLDSVDIVTAPHTYMRRIGGEDAYFRTYPASLARHGKLFMDESDDRTTLGSLRFAGGRRIMADTPEEAIGMLRREFGNAITHGVGQWFMDIDKGMFRDERYMKEIAQFVKCAERSLRLPKKRVSEVALIGDPNGAYYHSRETYPAAVLLYQRSMLQLSRAGAPFDFFCAADLDPETLRRYKVIILADAVAISGQTREILKSLRCDHRTILSFCGAGAVDRNGKFTPAEGMSDLTGIQFTEIPGQRMPHGLEDSSWDDNAKQSPGFAPLNADCDFGDWRSIYRAVPDFTAEEIRKIYRESGVHIYSETDDVISVSESALMLHASSSGKKKIHLPAPRIVADMITGRRVAEECIDEFTFQSVLGETSLFELSR